MAGVTHIAPNEKAGAKPGVFSEVVDYYPFGMQMPGRHWTADSSDGYRFGFNGVEKGNEWKGHGNHYTSKFRQYDPRVGRWFSIDPKAKKFPMQSPYVSMNNNPLYLKDPEGDAVVTAIVVGALASAAADYATQVAVNRAKGQSWEDAALNKVDWLDVGVSATAGGLGLGYLRNAKKMTQLGAAATEAGISSKLNWSPKKGFNTEKNSKAVAGFAISVTVGEGSEQVTKTLMKGFPTSGMAEEASEKLKHSVKEGISNATGKPLKEVSLEDENVEFNIKEKEGDISITKAKRENYLSQQAQKGKRKQIKGKSKYPVSQEEIEGEGNNAQLEQGR
jgi:RHS repeat-associated protein